MFTAKGLHRAAGSDLFNKSEVFSTKHFAIFMQLLILWKLCQIQDPGHMLRLSNGKTNLLVPKAPPADHFSNRKERKSNISTIGTNSYLVAALRWSWHFLLPLQPLHASRSCTVRMHNLCALSNQLFFHTLQKLLQCRLFWQWLCSDCQWRLWSWWTLGHSYWWRCWSVFCRSWLDHLTLTLK